MAYETLKKNVEKIDSIIYYQIDCISKHPEWPVLPVHATIQDQHATLQIDLSGLISLQDYLADHFFTKNDWIALFLSVGESILRCVGFFLDPSNFEVSLSTVYVLCGQENPLAGKIFLLYIPLARDSCHDPVHDFCMEALNFITPDVPATSGSPGKELFSGEEQDQIAALSLNGLENGLSKLHVMLESKTQSVHPKRKKPVKRKNPGLKQKAGEFIKNKMILSHVHFPDKPSVLFSVFGILAAEIALVIVAFEVLRHQTVFTNRLTPVLLVSVILLCFGFMDLFLLYNKKSPFYLSQKQEGSSTAFFEERESESIFQIKEEKTVLIECSSEIKRIAMICSGIPGTPEESNGQKAYILVDDFLIGRDGSKVDLKINSLSVGRIHARILRRENSFFIEDLDSRNGTYLDQKRLKKKEEYLLPENCKIRFADREFYFVAS